MSFETRSLRNNTAGTRKKFPTLTLNTDDDTIPANSILSPSNSAGASSLPVKTFEKKNFKKLSLGGSGSGNGGNSGLSGLSSNGGNGSIGGHGGGLMVPEVKTKRRSIQLVTMSSATPIEVNEANTLEGVLVREAQKLSIGGNNQNSTYTGRAKEQLITTKVSVSKITPRGGAIDKDGNFSLNNFKESDLVRLEDLGAGNSGSVLKVIHTVSQKTMAKKTIHIENNPEVKERIARELKIMNECDNKFIVKFYGSFLQEGNVIICMEYMDVGSLDKVLKMKGAFPQFMINHVAYSVLSGLKYLYTQHKIIHRDIKPSNVVLNAKGSLKLCDFGVSKEAIESVADTFVGTSIYMSPERILGARYNIKGDIWSLGLMLVEIGTGFFPFGDNAEVAPTGILDLLQRIVHEPPPNLSSFNEKYFAKHGVKGLDELPPKKLYPSQGRSKGLATEPVEFQFRKESPDYPFSQDLVNFVDLCLIKDEHERPSPSELLKNSFILSYKKELDKLDAEDLKQDIKDWSKHVKKFKSRLS